MNDEELLNDLFYVKHNYDGVNELYKKAKVVHPSIKKDFVSEWLKKQQNVQMNNEKVVKKKFLPIYSDTPYSFQLDLTFFPRYKKQNKNIYVLYTAININTRFAYAYYSKDKESKTILDLLKKQAEKTIINSITCDEGTEFKNSDFIKYCQENEIKLFFVKNDSHKMGIINRFHRTLKEKLTLHFSASNTVKWVDVIDEIVHNYNHSVNRGIGMAPYKVNSFIENELVQEKKEKTKELEIVDFVIGDKVRIKKTDTLFADKMTSRYSNTIYEVFEVKKNLLYVKGPRGDEYKIKKDNVIKVNDVSNKKSDDKVIKADKDHKKKLKLDREVGIDPINIIKETRRKKVVAPNNINGDIANDNIIVGKRVRKVINN